MSTTQKVIISNAYFTLRFHEKEKVVHHTYTELMDSEHVKELLVAGTQLMRDRGATKWISDNRLLVNNFNDEVTAWVNDVWLPDTMDAGWKYWALVVPEELAANADHAKFVDSFYDTGVWVTVWTDVEEAYRWITADDKT